MVYIGFSYNQPIGNQVKHLLIILSILLLGCVKNQGTEFLYQYKTSSGVIFKSIGDGKVQPKYKGEITNGKPNGFGVLTFPDGSYYVGEFKDGEENGQGTYIHPIGDKYVGEWKGGRLWNGREYDKDGNIIGKFVNGEVIKQ